MCLCYYIITEGLKKEKKWNVNKFNIKLCTL